MQKEERKPGKNGRQAAQDAPSKKGVRYEKTGHKIPNPIGPASHRGIDMGRCATGSCDTQGNGIQNSGQTAAIDISVHVKNPGDTALSNLTLFFISMTPVFKGQSILKVGSLAPHQSKDLSAHLEAPAFIGKKEVESRPLFFSGKYNDTYGTPGEFPVTSHPGGIK